MKTSDRVDVIKGVGPKAASNLQKLGIYTVGDLINHYPRNYDTFEAPIPVSSIEEGKICSIEAAVVKSAEVKRVRNLQIVTCYVKDPSGMVKLTWFNTPYIINTLKMGYRFIIRGKVTKKAGILVFEQPKVYTREEYFRLTNVMQPVYALTEGITSNAISKAVTIALAELPDEKEFIPLRIRKENGLIKRNTALLEIHHPKSRETMTDARRTLVFEEFFRFCVYLQKTKERKDKILCKYKMKESELCEQFISKLPFRLTEDQLKVWSEIKKDLSGDIRMSRLVQGDVGSGKTVVAFLAALMTIANGNQACLMVPTEVLAKQHFISADEMLAKYGVRTVLLTGSLSASEKKKIYEKIKNHEADLIIGTHALIQEKVEYDRLALVVIDEQHRFGVKQREALSKKGENVHLLVMSATPIPRTLAIILYGDLDISVIKQLPAERLPIKNCVVGTDYRNTAYKFIRGQVEAGHQAYIICPMVEESETIEAENVTDYAESLQEALPGIKTEILHGKMKPALKNEVMERFANGETQVLISTTVIEVGVNVPNATVMMIENAERFGLAQLHQLRGRVGRGKHQSYCIFVSGNTSKETMDRLEIMNKSNDGFFIASEDLRLRGPGDMFGIRQSGEIEFAIGDIYNDAELLMKCSEAVKGMSDSEMTEAFDIISDMGTTSPEDVVI